MPLRSNFVRNFWYLFFLGIALMPALLYLFFGYFSVKKMVVDDARLQSQRANEVIAVRPKVWRLKIDGLTEQISQVRHYKTSTLLTDIKGTELARFGESCTVCVSSHEPLMEFGDEVGAIKVTADLAPVLGKTALIGVIGLAIGLLLIRVFNGHLLALLKLKISSGQQNGIALSESEVSLRKALIISGIGSYTFDIKTRLWDCSEVLEQLFGIDRADWHTVDEWKALLHPDDRDNLIDYLTKEVVGHGKRFDREFRIIRRNDQTERWVHGLGDLEFDAQGHPLKMLGTIQDITDRKRAEDALVKLSMAVEQSPESIVITDLDGNIEYVNHTFTTESGYSLDEVLGKNPRILQSGKTPQVTYAVMWALLTRGKQWSGELINRAKDGREYLESVVISPVRQADGRITNYVAVKTDITNKRQAEERIERLAHFDQLTDLPNRSQLNDRFKFSRSLARRNGQQLAVMFLDLDHFKYINDTLGHSIGDQLLMEIATRLKSSLREQDTVSRMGGDEFILILPDTDADSAAHVAIKLIELISRPCQIREHELITTPSIGIAIYPNDGEDLETLSKNADAAMYQVKQGSRNDFRFFTQEMQEHSIRKLKLSNALRHALAHNELQLHYQPQMAMQDGHIVGAEALLRWQHPELGMISPGEFIPIAEDNGQIVRIGEWVLRTAARQLKDWLDNGLPPMLIAVNLSAVQFRQANITEVVTGILDEVGLAHEYLELELTEAAAMDDPKAAIAVMDKLLEQGIRMSIDDFGTGYSSLSYLKKFNVYKLKIDQSFVRNITDDPDDKAIVTAIINMANSLGMHTIAEGVETSGQLNFLRLQGCDDAQGYYFSKPLTAEQFEAYAKNISENNKILSPMKMSI